MILLLIIVVQHIPQRIAIMTSGHPGTAPWIVKVPGGTRHAPPRTSMVCTSMVRAVPKECNGTTGKTIMFPASNCTDLKLFQKYTHKCCLERCLETKMWIMILYTDKIFQRSFRFYV